MRTLLLLFIILPIISYSQRISFSSNENFNTIITTLYEGELINNKECKWRPNLSEKFQFKPINDSLYTSIDTTFTFKRFDIKNTIIITSTYSPNETCHACSPSLGIITLEHDEVNNKIIVVDFQKFVTKYGTWGEPGDVSLLEIGENNFCIKVTSNYSGMGMTGTYESLFYEGKKVLSYTSYEDNSGTTDNLSKIFEYNTSISIDKKKNNLLLTKKGSHLNQSTGKVNKVNSTTSYIFINNEFEKVCK